MTSQKAAPEAEVQLLSLLGIRRRFGDPAGDFLNLAPIDIFLIFMFTIFELGYYYPLSINIM
jgi:hypothetical protein